MRADAPSESNKHPIDQHATPLSRLVQCINATIILAVSGGICLITFLRDTSAQFEFMHAGLEHLLGPRFLITWLNCAIVSLASFVIHRGTAFQWTFYMSVPLLFDVIVRVIFSCRTNGTSRFHNLLVPAFVFIVVVGLYKFIGRQREGSENRSI